VRGQGSGTVTSDSVVANLVDFNVAGGRSVVQRFIRPVKILLRAVLRRMFRLDNQ
jgi:hypothetical protein